MTSRRHLLSLSALAVVLGRLTPVRAETAEQAVAFIRLFGDRLVAVVNGSGTAAERQRALTELLDRSVDVDGVARFCLSRFWNQATPEQQRRYVALFHQVLVANVTAKVGEYKGISYTIGSSRVEGGQEIVSTVVSRPNNPPTNVDWIVTRDTGSMKIIDMVAGGTSLRLTQRQDYTSFLSHNSNNVDALITAMRNQV